ncbi:glycosyltransferase [Porphyromonas sp. COT-290 OH860]|uniref:glycosyltransferase n=1 Tax=Porphyromonas sp. COT-290 OH860 TaxID=1515615 RepID=UPI00052BEB6E|nr:glycosyltransferase [Porphyromonas sp. COT-290 OH860]KGN86241.1 hypothetical protein HQ41_01630 [Porphyromonas sp. COT-290 OH860]
MPDNENKSYTNDNGIALVAELQSRRIEMLVFVSWLDKRYARLVRESVNCKIAFWLHSQPFWEVKRTYLREKALAKEKWSYFFRFYAYSYWRNYVGKRFLRGMQNSYKEDIQLVDYVIVLCPEFKQELTRSLVLSAEEQNKIKPVVNTIVLNPTPILHKKQEIAYLGRLSRDDKQLHKLLAVWSLVHKQLSGWSLHIYGSGSDEKRLKKIVEQKHLDRVTFHGYKRNTQEVYDRTSIVCLTSFFEGWPMVLIEAQNNGCIPVSFNNGFGVQSIIGKDSKNGILVPQDDVLAFSNALLRLCSNQELRTELQNNVLKKRLDYVPSVNEETWNKILGKSTDREEL